MPRSFNFSALTKSATAADFRDPRLLVRLVLGLLVALNLIAAAFVFHIFGRSAQETAAELAAVRATVVQQRNQLNRTRQIANKVETARGAGDEFLARYMTPRRTTYSTLVSEMQQICENAHLTWKEGSIAPLEPVKGSEDLSMMTMTVSVEGTYANLLNLINLLDRSPRFLIIDQLAAVPQPGGKGLSVTLKINTFVREDNGGAI